MLIKSYFKHSNINSSYNPIRQTIKLWQTTKSDDNQKVAMGKAKITVSDRHQKYPYVSIICKKA